MLSAHFATSPKSIGNSSRIAEVAGPGEVLVSEAVMETVDNPALHFVRADRAGLKGIAEPVLVSG